MGESKVLARIDSNGEYGPKNVHWRKARSPQEERWGIEDIGLTEPDEIPLTKAQRKERGKLSGEKLRMFDIWARMVWRGKHYGPGKN